MKRILTFQLACFSPSEAFKNLFDAGFIGSIENRVSRMSENSWRVIGYVCPICHTLHDSIVAEYVEHTIYHVTPLDDYSHFSRYKSKALHLPLLYFPKCKHWVSDYDIEQIELYVNDKEKKIQCYALNELSPNQLRDWLSANGLEAYQLEPAGSLGLFDVYSSEGDKDAKTKR